MPFNALLLSCLVHGTSFSEKGARVSICPQPGETILFFNVDTQSNRDCSLRQVLGTEGDVVCDLIVFYARKDVGEKVICLVELKKGSDIKHAAKQITNTYQHFRQALAQTFLRRTAWKACICLHGSAPKDTRKVRKTLEQTFGKGEVDITRNSDLGEFLRA